VKGEQQRFVVRQRHAVRLRRVAPNLADEPVRITCTGQSDEVVIDEARFPGRQGRLLFAYLVAEEGRPVPRDELAEVEADQDACPIDVLDDVVEFVVFAGRLVTRLSSVNGTLPVPNNASRASGCRAEWWPGPVRDCGRIGSTSACWIAW
jgi:hypothetical protein